MTDWRITTPTTTPVQPSRGARGRDPSRRTTPPRRCRRLGPRPRWPLFGPSGKRRTGRCRGGGGRAASVQRGPRPTEWTYPSGRGDRAAAALQFPDEPHTAFSYIARACWRPRPVRLRDDSRPRAHRRWGGDGRAARAASGSHLRPAAAGACVDRRLLELGRRSARVGPRALDRPASWASLGGLRVGAPGRWLAVAARTLGARLSVTTIESSAARLRPVRRRVQRAQRDCPSRVEPVLDQAE